jgi:two-component system LytT family response regulator
VTAETHAGKIRTVIVDDEPLARTSLSLLLRLDAEVEVLAECGSGVDAPDEIRRAKPDLLFLDVQMPECDGFDVIELLGKDVPPAVVFVTAYDQYALRAFEAGALDYLLKPFDDARFVLALDRAKQKIARGKDRPKQIEYLTVKSAGQVTFVTLDSIDWIEAADYYVGLHVGPKTHLLRRSITELEQDLDPTVFFRIHRSTIVNLKRIRGLKLNEDGEYTVLLESGTCLRLSRRYRRPLQARLGLRLLHRST